MDASQDRSALRIELIDNLGLLTVQARSYAEYRVFASLARHAPAVRAVSVELGRNVGDANGIACAITITLAPTGCVQVRATAKHPYAAIDRAAQRVADAMQPLACAPRRPLRGPLA